MSQAAEPLNRPIEFEMNCWRAGSQRSRRLRFERLIVAGWTGRDPDAVAHHIVELEALGVRPPSTTPLFYELSPELLTTRPVIHTVGNRSSGEAEIVLLSCDSELWITVGSDHTDRALETVSVSKSKQVCSKPIAGSVWAFDEIIEHWDSVELRCYATRDGRRELYQHGKLSRNLHPEVLIAELASRISLDIRATGTALFCGTQPVEGQIRAADCFELELFDPVRDRRICHSYHVNTLPDVE